MRKTLVVLAAATFLTIFAAGCTAVGTSAGVQADGGGAPPQAAAPSAAQPSSAVPAPAETPPKEAVVAAAPAERLSVEEVQKRRELETTLRSSFESFWSLIKQKNVDSAIELVALERREEIRNEFYRFVAKYNVTRYDITDLVGNFGTTSDSEVSGIVMVYEKGTVTPIKKEIFQRWKQSGKWYLNSSSFK
jgi:hypothetical protein